MVASLPAKGLIPPERVPRVDLLGHVIQVRGGTVVPDDIATLGELGHVPDDL